jgi:hypothetical protein
VVNVVGKKLFIHGRANLTKGQIKD